MTWDEDGQKAIIFKEIERYLFNINLAKPKKLLSYKYLPVIHNIKGEKMGEKQEICVTSFSEVNMLS